MITPLALAYPSADGRAIPPICLDDELLGKAVSSYLSDSSDETASLFIRELMRFKYSTGVDDIIEGDIEFILKVDRLSVCVRF